MKTLTILLAHGSSDPAWGETFIGLTQRACEREDTYLAFMELSSPSLEEIVSENAAKGYTHLCVLPLFLAKGRHLKVDIPKKLRHIESQHPLTTKLLPPIGEHPRLAEALNLILDETLDT